MVQSEARVEPQVTVDKYDRMKNKPHFVSMY